MWERRRWYVVGGRRQSLRAAQAISDEGPAHGGRDRGDAARLPPRRAAIAGDGGEEILVAVIDVAPHHRGQRHLLPQPGQTAQIPARAGEGTLCILPRGAANRDGVELQLELTARSEEHTSELQSLMRISSAVFCLKK